MPNYRISLIPLLFTVLLLGCDNKQPEQMLETYSVRVANSLDMGAEELDLSHPLKLPSYPRRVSV